jgi:hypothetical protein
MRILSDLSVGEKRKTVAKPPGPDQDGIVWESVLESDEKMEKLWVRDENEVGME